MTSLAFFASLGDVLVKVGIGVALYFLLSLLAIGAYTLWLEGEERRERQGVERRAFERHAAKELADHMRVVGGNHISSDERWGRAA